MTTELEDLLLNAQSEIRQLRQANQILGAKVDTFEKLHSFLHAQPAPERNQGASIDVCWSIQKTLDRLKQEAAAKAVS